MTSWMTGAPSGKNNLMGKARAVYEDSGFDGPELPGSVDGGREGMDDEVGWSVDVGIGSGSNLEAIRINRS